MINVKDVIGESYLKLEKQFNDKIVLLNKDLLEVLLYSKCLEYLAYTEPNISNVKGAIQAINQQYERNNLLIIAYDKIKENEPF